MRKFLISVLIIGYFGLMLAGCNVVEEDSEERKSIIIPTNTPDNTNLDTFTQQIQQTELGSFYIGPQKEEAQVFVYSGQEVHIPFKVEGMSQVQTNFGLMLFVDGYSQPFKIEKEDGEMSKEDFMHKFSLSKHEVEMFDIVFTPITGKQGEKVGIVFAGIFNPNFIPESKDNPNYGVYHSITAPLPQELYFETGVLNPTKKDLVKYIEEDIPQYMIDKYTKHGSRRSLLDERVIISLLPEGIDRELNNNVFISDNNKIKLRLRIMGGIDGDTYRTTIYVNHKPVKIMGCDSIKTTVKKGKMYTIEFELDTREYNQLSTIYAISNPCGRDYLSSSIFPIKSKSRLIVSE